MTSASSIKGICILCQKTDLALCCSHLLPAAIARWVTMSHQISAGSKAPIYFTQHTVVQKDVKIADFVLCRECEDRFNFGGEQWVLANAYRGGSRFKLRSALRAAVDEGRPNIPLEHARIVLAKDVRGIDMDKLVYFAASIFWRAAAHRWRQIDRHIQIEIGPYQEHLRRFLLGREIFPENAALVISVADDASPHMSAVYPYSGRAGGMRQHRFSMPGMTFWLHLGRIPESLTAICAAHSSTLCLVPNLNETVVHDFLKLRSANKKVREIRLR